MGEARFTLNTNKMLPSLPNPKTGSIRRPSAPSTIKKSNLRQRSMSSSSSGHLTPSRGSDTQVPSIPSSSSLMSTSLIARPSSSPQLPRQLQLPRGVTNTNGQVPVPVPGLSSGSRLCLPSTSSTLPPTPTTPTSPDKPKSRVGTGMAYRSSSSSGMRLPSARTPVVGPKF
jgi:hypothetical protein